MVSPSVTLCGNGLLQATLLDVRSGTLLFTVEESVTFQQKHLPPFAYMRGGKLTPTSYYEAPPEVFEDRDEAALWRSTYVERR